MVHRLKSYVGRTHHHRRPHPPERFLRLRRAGHRQHAALSAARPLAWFARVAAWCIRPLALTSRGILRLLGKAAQGEKVFISAEEILLLMQEGQEKGVFDRTEQELIHRVFEFTDMSVKEVMVPRPKMCAIEIDTPTPDLLKYIDENKFSRYPVYREGLNDLLGILYQKDLLSQVAAGKPLNLKDLLHPVYYVPEAMKVSVLLKEMQRRRIHMAIVVNEYGSVEGLVTLEDLIEEIVGEIQDEYDTEEKPVERLQDGAILLDASIPVKDLVSEYGLPIPPSPDYETLGGILTYPIQRPPPVGHVFFLGDSQLPGGGPP